MTCKDDWISSSEAYHSKAYKCGQVNQPWLASEGRPQLVVAVDWLVIDCVAVGWHWQLASASAAANRCPTE